MNEHPSVSTLPEEDVSITLSTELVPSEHQQALLSSTLEALDMPHMEQALALMLAQQQPAEIALLLESLPPDDQLHTWQALSIEAQATASAYLPGPLRSALLGAMEMEALSAVVEKMDVDYLAGVMDVLPTEVSDALFDSLDAQHRQRLATNLTYPDDSAARLMHTDVISVRPSFTLERVLRYLRRHKPPRYTDGIMVTNKDNVYLGKLFYTDLLHQPPDTKVAEVMVEHADWINAKLPQDEVALLFEQHTLISTAVVDDDGKFIGRISANDVVWLARAKGEEALLKRSGLSGDEGLFAPVLPSAKRRAVWLGINLLTAFLAAWVIGLFEATLQQVVALAVLMPIVASMGGITGSQTLTLIIRGLALGQVNPVNALWLTYKEFAIEWRVVGVGSSNRRWHLVWQRGYQSGDRRCSGHQYGRCSPGRYCRASGAEAFWHRSGAGRCCSINHGN